MIHLSLFYSENWKKIKLNCTCYILFNVSNLNITEIRITRQVIPKKYSALGPVHTYLISMVKTDFGFSSCEICPKGNRYFWTCPFPITHVWMKGEFEPLKMILIREKKFSAISVTITLRRICERRSVVPNSVIMLFKRTRLSCININDLRVQYGMIWSGPWAEMRPVLCLVCSPHVIKNSTSFSTTVNASSNVFLGFPRGQTTAHREKQ